MEDLTDLEIEVMLLVGRGLRNQDIAICLGKSLSRVKALSAAAAKKRGIKGRGAFAIWAAEQVKQQAQAREKVVGRAIKQQAQESPQP